MKKKLLLITALFGILLGGCTGGNSASTSSSISSISEETSTTSEEATKKDFEGVSFNDESYVYDGKTHKLKEVSGAPLGTTITYVGRDNQINVGEYKATATLIKEGYNTKTLEATLSITPASFKNISFNDKSVKYDGSEHSLLCSNVPSFATVTYQNNKGTEIGTYNATATITAPNYNPLTLKATLTITKGDIKGITFTDTSFTYDNEEHEIKINGSLPTGVNVSYTNNKRTDAGSQEATATLTGDNYNILVLKATLTINKAVFTGITFEDLTIQYDGETHTITASGVPSFASVTYLNNSASEPGTYKATATISADNYETLVLNATLTIALNKITGVTFESQEFDYDGNEHEIFVSGTLPEGVTVTYTNNKRTEIGYQIATATLTGTYYETLVLTASITILDPNEDTLKCTNEENLLTSSTDFGNGNGVLTTDRNKTIEFSYYDAKTGEPDNWLTLNKGGYIYNVTPVESFTDLTLTFLDGYEKFKVYYSYSEGGFDNAHSKEYTASAHGIKTPDIIYERKPLYFKIENIDDKEITLEDLYAYIDLSIFIPTLTLSVNDSNLGTVTGGDKYKAGDKVVVKATPTSSNYVFDSWKNNDKIVSLEQEYTFTMPDKDLSLEAVFVTKSQHEWDLAHGVRPTIDLTNKTAKYGMYPKTHVVTQSLINNLNNLEEKEANGWYFYNDEYYAKVIATPYKWTSDPSYIPEFDDGMEIYEGETYWFKVEPIEWSIRRTSYSDGYYYLLSKYLLDIGEFYSSNEERTIDEKKVYPNNYQYSDIRTWLNNDFYSQAFSLDDSCLFDVTINNAKSTTNNANGSYYSDNTIDKIFLPSYKELTTYDYGFGSNETRRAKTTDYSRAVGVCYMKDNEDETYFKFNAQYWTRSPDNSTYGGSTFITTVQQNGFIGNLSSEQVKDKNTAVRPAVSFKPL